MGVTGLMNMIKNFAPNSIKNKTITSYKNKIMVVDANNVLYRMSIGLIKNKGLDKTKTGKIKIHIKALLMTIITNLNNGIVPIYIFDGKAPNHKKYIIEYRKKIIKKNSNKEHQKFVLTKEMYDDCKYLLEILGIPYIQCPEEADAQCASMVVTNNSIYGSITEDLDHLIFGAEKVIVNFKAKSIIKEITLSDLLKELEISYENFVDICVLNSVEKLPSIKGINFSGIIGKYKTIMKNNKTDKYENIKEFLKLINEENSNYINNGKKPKYIIPENYLEQCIDLKDYFETTAKVVSPLNMNININNPQRDKIFQFLHGMFELDSKYIIGLINKIDNLSKYWKCLYVNNI